MNSMTGYGRGRAVSEGLEIVVEITSVNRRNAEFSTFLPREWQSLEPLLVEKLRTSVERGKVHAAVQVQSFPPGEEFCWDEEAVENSLEKLSGLAKRRGVPFEPDAALLFQVASQHLKPATLPDSGEVEGLVLKAIDEALEEVLKMRAREGAALLNDLKTRCELLQLLLEGIRAEAANVPPNYREILLQRLRQAGLEIDLDDERVLKEIAIFSERCDISEEITRLGSHLDQLPKDLNSKGSIGRKLDFLLQEIQREFNTIGAKANNLEISKKVIEAKDEVARLREQAMNVE